MKKYIQEHKYVLLVLYLPIYLIWFALVERMVPSTECLSSSTPFWMCLRRLRCRWCCT